MDLAHLCRTCLNKHDQIQMQSIYDYDFCEEIIHHEDSNGNEDIKNKSITKTNLSNMIATFGVTTMSERNNLPTKICLKCVEHVKISYQFKKQCETALETLKSMLKQNDENLNIIHDRTKAITSATSTSTTTTITFDKEKEIYKYIHDHGLIERGSNVHIINEGYNNTVIGGHWSQYINDGINEPNEHTYDNGRSDKFSNKDQCNESSSSSNDKQTQTDEYIYYYPCEMCYEKFVDQCTLKAHRQQQHPEQRCRVCNKEYTKISLLRRHLIAMHPAEDYPTTYSKSIHQIYCKQCHRRFPTNGKFLKHIAVNENCRTDSNNIEASKEIARKINKQSNPIELNNVRYGIRMVQKNADSKWECTNCKTYWNDENELREHQCNNINDRLDCNDVMIASAVDCNANEDEDNDGHGCSNRDDYEDEDVGFNEEDNNDDDHSNGFAINNEFVEIIQGNSKYEEFSSNIKLSQLKRKIEQVNDDIVKNGLTYSDYDEVYLKCFETIFTKDNNNITSTTTASTNNTNDHGQQMKENVIKFNGTTDDKADEPDNNNYIDYIQNDVDFELNKTVHLEYDAKNDNNLGNIDNNILNDEDFNSKQSCNRIRGCGRVRQRDLNNINTYDRLSDVPNDIESIFVQQSSAMSENNLPNTNQQKTNAKLSKKVKNRIACDLCKKTFVDLEKYSRHKECHAKPKAIKSHACTACEKTFRRIDQLKRHSLIHSHDETFDCKLCDKKFSRMDHLHIHTASHLTQNDEHHDGNCDGVVFKCNACDQKFTRNIDLRRHQSRKHKAITIKNGKRPAAIKTEFCQICFRGFTTEKYLHIHMKIHSVRTFNCKFCADKFQVKTDLTEHQKTHANERPFLCSECGLRFVRNDYLVIHMRRHKGEKPYKCKFCGKGFPRATDLTVHERYHTGEKTHLCTICGKGFQRAYNLLVHTRVHTGERPYQCPHCTKSFAQGNDLKAHVRRHTGERYKCDICGDGFVQGYHLTQHKRNIHGIDMQSHIRRVQKFLPGTDSNGSAIVNNAPMKTSKPIAASANVRTRKSKAAATVAASAAALKAQLYQQQLLKQNQMEKEHQQQFIIENSPRLFTTNLNNDEIHVKIENNEYVKPNHHDQQRQPHQEHRAPDKNQYENELQQQQPDHRQSFHGIHVEKIRCEIVNSVNKNHMTIGTIKHEITQPQNKKTTPPALPPQTIIVDTNTVSVICNVNPDNTINYILG